MKSVIFLFAAVMIISTTTLSANSFAGENKKMSEHTFMFQDWEWAVEGQALDIEGNVNNQSGTIRFERPDDLVKTIYEYKCTSEQPMENMVYEMIPFKKGSETTTWKTVHPHAGPMNGTYWIFGDRIISHYASENGMFTGGDFYEKLSDEKYRVTGTVYMNGNPLAKWELVMTKK